jgi:hypothetical protein
MKRMSKILDKNQPVEQAGFRSQICTIDHLQATNQLIEKALEFNLRPYIAFVVYKKAFDSAEHKPILQ